MTLGRGRAVVGLCHGPAGRRSSAAPEAMGLWSNVQSRVYGNGSRFLAHGQCQRETCSHPRDGRRSRNHQGTCHSTRTSKICWRSSPLTRLTTWLWVASVDEPVGRTCPDSFMLHPGRIRPEPGTSASGMNRKPAKEAGLAPVRSQPFLPSDLRDLRALCVNKLANPVYGGSSCATTLASFPRQSGMGPRMASVGARSSTL